MRAQADAVLQTLEEIEADHIPVLTAINKIDRLGDPQAARIAVDAFPDAVAISALTGEGVDDLLNAVQTQLYEMYTPLKVHLPYTEGKLISLFHEQGQIEHIEHGNGGVLIQGRIPGRFVAQFGAYLRRRQNNEE